MKKIFLICGIIASVLCIGTDIFTAMTLDGYSYLDQAVSELTAIGASTRPMVVTLLAICNVLLIAFGLGVRMSAQEKRLRLVGNLIVIFAIVGLVSLNFPMNQRGVDRTFSDTMHLAFGGVAVLLMVLFIGFGTVSFGKKFRYFSIGTILAILGFGIWAGTQGAKVAMGISTPWFGVIERVSYYLPFIWLMALAVALLRKDNSPISENI